MNLGDPAGRLEYFADGKNASFFAPAIENTKLLLVSSINCYEVFKRIAQQRDEDAAIPEITSMPFSCFGSIQRMDDDSHHGSAADCGKT